MLITFNTNYSQIIKDYSASLLATFSKTEYIPRTYQPLSKVTIYCNLSSLLAIRISLVSYTIKDNNGNKVYLYIDKVLYLPKLLVRLLSP